MADFATLGFLKNLRDKYLEVKFEEFEDRFDELERKMNKKFEELSEKLDKTTKQ